MKTSSAQGFTTVELMITVMVMAVTVTIAVPSFLQAIQNNRLTAQANDLLSSLNYARSEAVKQGVQVTICKANVTTNPTQCDTSVNWESGWIIFVDQNTIGTIDGTDTMLRVHEALPTSYTLRTGTHLTNWVAYLPSGAGKGSGGLVTDTFRMCPSGNDTTKARSIVLNTVGRPMVSTGTAQCP